MNILNIFLPYITSVELLQTNLRIESMIEGKNKIYLEVNGLLVPLNYILQYKNIIT